MNKIILFLALVAFTSVNTSFLGDVSKAHYAVIVAGSNGYWNYRHQADAFHAYHILRNNGMPAENIILFAYDDVANNKMNPFPGQVFNKPSEGPGQDYYKDVVIDYKGKDVTPENFLNVLEGNAEKMKGIGSGRVLSSTSSDNVFINFADHGAPGLIAFPQGELYADQLQKTFEVMNKKNMYNQLVFYLEACESGSMFNNILPDNMRIYASSAANTSESSWGCYCGSAAKVNGKNIGSCLGDLYSVNWMEDSDLATKAETIEEQFAVILKKTDKSHPMEWGDRTFEKEQITDFQGTTDSTSEEAKLISDIKSYAKKFFGISETKKVSLEEQIYLDNAKRFSIDSRDIKLHYLYDLAFETNEPAHKSELEQELHMRKVTDTIFENFAMGLELNVLEDKNDNLNLECIREGVNFYKLTCQNFNEYTLKYVKHISNACKKYDINTVKEALSNIC